MRVTHDHKRDAYNERYNAYSIEEYMQYIGLSDMEVCDMSSNYTDTNVCRYAIGQRYVSSCYV